MLMILPPSPCSIRTRPTSCAKSHAPVRLTSITFCHPASGTSTAGAPQVVPALLTSTSIRPNSATVRSTTTAICAGSRTSQPIPMARTPYAPASSRAASMHRSSLRAHRTRSAPQSASASAICLPIPAAPPVTIATFPRRSKSS